MYRAQGTILGALWNLASDDHLNTWLSSSIAAQQLNAPSCERAQALTYVAADCHSPGEMGRAAISEAQRGARQTALTGRPGKDPDLLRIAQQKYRPCDQVWRTNLILGSPRWA